jgi:endonuclease-3 related protein
MDILGIYQKLLEHFGKQHWWPADTRFEIIIGAILIHQTNWRSVERAIENLKSKGLLNPHSLAKASSKQIEALLRHLNFFRNKAKRIIGLSRYLTEEYDGSLKKFFNKSTEEIREELLSLEGIGKETADSILLYAADRFVFPIDAYTIRLCNRLGISETKYEKLRSLFEITLPRDLEVYKELHALVDKLGKTYCKSKPNCYNCPLADDCLFYEHFDIKIDSE